MRGSKKITTMRGTKKEEEEQQEGGEKRMMSLLRPCLHYLLRFPDSRLHRRFMIERATFATRWPCATRKRSRIWNSSLLKKDFEGDDGNFHSCSLKRGAAFLRKARPYTQNPRPFLSHLALCAMAIHNSPSGYVTSSDVYEFILHHFPHFKDVNPNWKNTVRNALSLKKQFFKAIGADTASKGLTYAFVEGVMLEQCLNSDCWKFMKEKDQRTFAYYKWILQGQDRFLWNRQAAKQRARGEAENLADVLQMNGRE